MLDKKARHFHAGKLRKKVGGVEYVEVAESNGKVFVARNGTFLTPRHQDGAYRGLDNGHGYLMIGSPKGTPIVKSYAHVIVFEVFVRPVDGEVDHINRDRSDNRLANLRDVSRLENIHMPGTVAARKAATGRRVLNVDLGVAYDTETDAAKDVGVSRKTIQAALAGRCKTAGGYHWRYTHD